MRLQWVPHLYSRRYNGHSTKTLRVTPALIYLIHFLSRIHMIILKRWCWYNRDRKTRQCCRYNFEASAYLCAFMLILGVLQYIYKTWYNGPSLHGHPWKEVVKASTCWFPWTDWCTRRMTLLGCWWGFDQRTLGGSRQERRRWGRKEERERSSWCLCKRLKRLLRDVGPWSTLIALMVPSLYPSFISCSYVRRRFWPREDHFDHSDISMNSVTQSA